MSVILITGCSSGFGLNTAACLAASDHTIYASMRDLQKKDDLLEEVARRGGEVHLVRLDVTDDKTIKAAIEQIEEEAGRLDVIINNAGYAIGGFFEDFTEQEIRDQMETNFFGMQKVIRHALPLLRKTAEVKSSGNSVKIINITSVQGRAPSPGLSAYASSKFAMEGFSESLYFELKPFGIHVVLVEPGAYRTKIFTDNAHLAKNADKPDSPYKLYSKRLRDIIIKMLKSKTEMGDPEDVAILLERIVMNPSPKLRYLIGHNAKLRTFIRQVLPFSWYAALVNKVMVGKE